MAVSPTTPTKRLEEIIDFYSLLLTVAQIESYRKTLLPEELEALDAYIDAPGEPTPAPKPPPLEPEPVKPPARKNVTPPKPARKDLLPVFLAWVKFHPGFQLGQLLGLFSIQYKLTNEELGLLKEQIAKLPPEKRPPEKPPEKPPPEKPPEKKPVPAELLITRTPYPKWWKDLIVGGINITGNGTQVIVSGGGTRDLYVATIALVVSGEAHISFGFGGSAGSGSMHFGGGIQPGGIVISMSDSPAPCGRGGFSVSATGGDPENPPHIGGFAVCFSEADILPA